LFLHRVVVSSFFSSSSNTSTRSLDVIVVGRSKKPRKRVERLSPHLYKERDDSSCLCAFGQNNKQIFPAKKQKKTPSFFHHFVGAFFFVPISPFCAVSPKKQKENRKISSFWKRERRMSSKPSARKQNTHTHERKKNSREQKAHERVQVKVRDRFRPFFPLALLRVRCEIARARVEISSERAPFSFFSKDSEKKQESSFCAFPIRVHKANSSLSKGRFSRTRTRPCPLLSS